MARAITLDEFHLTIRAPHGLPDAEYLRVRRTLNDRRFRAALQRAVRVVFGRFPTLGKVEATLSR